MRKMSYAYHGDGVSPQPVQRRWSRRSCRLPAYLADIKSAVSPTSPSTSTGSIPTLLQLRLGPSPQPSEPRSPHLPPSLSLSRRNNSQAMARASYPTSASGQRRAPSALPSNASTPLVHPKGGAHREYRAINSAPVRQPPKPHPTAT